VANNKYVKIEGYKRWGNNEELELQKADVANNK